VKGTSFSKEEVGGVKNKVLNEFLDSYNRTTQSGITGKNYFFYRFE
jgi:hypothetical protein